MKCIKNKVNEELRLGNIGSNRTCPYHPSHFKGQNCSFCYCPFFPCNDRDLGQTIISKTGKEIWDCSPCLFIHKNDVVEYTFERVRELGIECAEDPRFKEIFSEAKERFYVPNRSIMILGATSDAGKSLTVAALCRILWRRGYTVTPFKSQNMSLNSRVTIGGHEISMIQDIQCRACGIVSPSSHVNPILLKPKGDCTSQVIAEGVPFGDYNVEDYYERFIPEHGMDIVRRNIEYLKSRYDFMIMEGAGSPAEINIYDRDIANMKAAEMADADCILVVNVEYGGSFAYAAGTLDLLPENDRSRVKGIILNNLRGEPSSIKDGADELERITGVPVIGIIPHLEITLPKEDSECFRDSCIQGSGSKTIAVIKLPHISNFTDMDPFALEDVTLIYTESPKEVRSADAIVIPGTKNTLSDLDWMKKNGLFDVIKEECGKKPIVGVCGGYQMMAKSLYDPNGIEDDRFPETNGLGLFEMDIRWDDYKKCVRRVSGKLTTGDCGQIDGYEIHMGHSENCKERPLIDVDMMFNKYQEGSVNEEKMLFGTYIHGIFDRPSFRKQFLSLMKCECRNDDFNDYEEFEESNLDILADGFERYLDMNRFWKIMKGE